MDARLLIISRYTLLEALRTPLLWSAAAGVVTLALAAAFVEQLALIEALRVRTAAYAVPARLAAVFGVCIHVVTSMAREFDDKGLDLALALDVPRWQFVAGKWLGHFSTCVLIAGLAAMPLWLLAPPHAVLAWQASLTLELAVVAAAAIFAAVTLAHPVLATAFVAAFYALCRMLGALRLMSEHPIAGADEIAHRAAATALRAVELLLPPLGDWTRTAWLLDATPAWSQLGALLAMAAIYVALLLCATLIDFYRKAL